MEEIKSRTIIKHIGRGIYTTIETEPNKPKRRKKRIKRKEKVQAPDHWERSFKPKRKNQQ